MCNCCEQEAKFAPSIFKISKIHFKAIVTGKILLNIYNWLIADSLDGLSLKGEVYASTYLGRGDLKLTDIGYHH